MVKWNTCKQASEWPGAGDGDGKRVGWGNVSFLLLMVEERNCKNMKCFNDLFYC